MLQEILTIFPLLISSRTFIKSLSVANHWVNNLDSHLRNSENFGIFKNILKFFRPKPNSFFNCRNLKGIRLITRLRLELSHLHEHKFKYNFQNSLNPPCSCGSSIESTSHFLLHCLIFHDKRHTLLSTLNNIDSKLLESNDSYLTQTLLFGSTSFDSETNTLVLNATIDYRLFIYWTSRGLLHLTVFVFFVLFLFFCFLFWSIMYNFFFVSVFLLFLVFPDTLDFQCLVVLTF